MIENGIWLAAGMLAGLLHFGGLWLTVERAVHAGRPAFLLVLSGAIRFAVLAGVIGLAATRGAVEPVAALTGILVSRQALVARLRPERAGPAAGRR